MSFKIQDGKGSGREAGVTDEGQLEVEAITIPEIAHVSAEHERAWIIATGFVALTTTGSFNGLIYVKNTSTRPLHIESIRTCSTGSGYTQVKVIKNPTTGTLISEANAAIVTNANLSSTADFGGLGYTAAGDAKTVTDGSDTTQFTNMSPGHSVQHYQGAVVLGQGDSCALVAKPSAAGDVCSEIVCYFGED